MTTRICTVTAALLLGASPALAQPAPAAAVTVSPPPIPEKPTEKKDLPKPSVISKIDVAIYGFVEMDSIWDSTQGFNDAQGNAAIARPGTYAGDHPQLTWGARNSRIGLKLGAPAPDGVKITGQMEMDFLGNQPPGISEASFWANAPFRLRHMNLKIETPVVDLLFGQTWQLFGWQGMNQPNTVAIQGIPGQVYSRAPQLRVSKKIKANDAVSVELAVAASRPVARASYTPDGQAGVRVNFDRLKAWHTGGSTGSSLDSAMIGASVVGRRFAADQFSATPHSQVVRDGYGISIDALFPILTATKADHGNALTLQGSYVTGAGIADLYSGLSGGVGNPPLPNPAGATPAPVYTPNVDNGLVLFHEDAGGTFSLHPIQWTSYLIGAQYYLPGGNVWLTGNYTHLSSDNAHLYGAPAKVFGTVDWFDGNLFWDATAYTRFGLEYARTQQTYADGTQASNNRVQLSAFLLF